MNFKLPNCAQDCPLRLLSSVFCYSVLLFFLSFFFPFVLTYLWHMGSLYKNSVMSHIPSLVLFAFHIVAGRSVCIWSVVFLFNVFGLLVANWDLPGFCFPQNKRIKRLIRPSFPSPGAILCQCTGEHLWLQQQVLFPPGWWCTPAGTPWVLCPADKPPSPLATLPSCPGSYTRLIPV